MKRAWVRALVLVVVLGGVFLLLGQPIEREGTGQMTGDALREESTSRTGEATLLTALAFAPAQQGTAAASVQAREAVPQATVQIAYGKLPLHFEANQGQTDRQVKFLARGRGYSLFLTATEAVLVLRQSSDQPHKHSLASGERARVKGVAPEQTGQASSQSNRGAVLRMQLVGASPASQMVGLEELPGKANYFIGNDPTKWRTNIPTYAKVEYREVYPGVNLVYYGNQGQLEYDFTVAPGADPKAIKLAFDSGAAAPGLSPYKLTQKAISFCTRPMARRASASLTCTRRSTASNNPSLANM